MSACTGKIGTSSWWLNWLAVALALGTVGCWREHAIVKGQTKDGHHYALTEAWAPFEGYGASFLFLPSGSTQWLRFYISHQGPSWRKTKVDVLEEDRKITLAKEGKITHYLVWSPQIVWVQVGRGLTNVVTEGDFWTPRVPPSLRRMETKP
ncbi:MAG: hypothetical protein RMH97_01975 [Verrucomicrobiales bacterium]|nr:hypothetical protein [Verrucomicrobiales bacterium]